MRIAIKNLKIKLHGHDIHLRDHPYAQSILNNDRKKFRHFVKHQPRVQRHKRSGTWSGIKALAKSLDHGFDKHHLKDIKIEGLRCKHGRHRMCLLSVLYPKSEVIVKHGQLKKFIGHR